MAILIGQSIGRYHIMEQLGEGGMATVYKAFDNRLERDVAVKTIRVDQFAPAVLDRILKRFEREAKALARLTHPNIVHVNDYGEHDGVPYLVIDYLPGGTLKQRLGRPMPWQEAVLLLLPIAEALDYAHGQNIIHRDVKPSNILLTQRGQPMLTDFGIAKILEDDITGTLSAPGTGVGTPEYMAPEQWIGQAGPLADLYSLGVVLYELVTGRKPYTADTPAAIMLKQANDPLPSPRQFVPDLPEEVEKILFKALAKRPEDRYQNMHEFAAALNKALNVGQTIEVQEKPKEATKGVEKTVLVGGMEKKEEEFARRVPSPAEPVAKRKIPWVWLAVGLIPIIALIGWSVSRLARQASLATRPTQTMISTAALQPVVNSPVPTVLPTVTRIPPTQVPVGSAEAVCKNDAAGCAVFSPIQTIRIGMGAPMTGDNAVFGQDISQAAKIAVSDAVRFQGFLFELVVKDDRGIPDGGVTTANEFVSDPQVVAVAAHIFSGAAKAAMPIYEAAAIPMMSPSATNPELTTIGSRVFNRCTFTDAAQGKFAAAYLFNKLGVRSLAILHDGQAYGLGLAKVVYDQFTILGGTVVAYNAITPGKSDYNAALADIASLKPQAIFYGGYTPEAVIIVNQMKQAGLSGVTFFGDDGTFGQDFLDHTGASGEGAYSTSLLPPTSEAKAKFDAVYLETYGKPAGTLSPYTWSGYDSVAVLIDRIKSVAILGSDGRLYIPRDALVAAVRATRGYMGLSGMITCDVTGECAATGPTFFLDHNGKWVEAPK